MTDLARFLVAIAAILAAYVVLHVLRSFNVAAEARGICAGIVGYAAAMFLARPAARRRRRRR